MLQPDKTQYIIQTVTGKQLLNSVKQENTEKQFLISEKQLGQFLLQTASTNTE